MRHCKQELEHYFNKKFHYTKTNNVLHFKRNALINIYKPTHPNNAVNKASLSETMRTNRAELKRYINNRIH